MRSQSISSDNGELRPDIYPGRRLTTRCGGLATLAAELDIVGRTKASIVRLWTVHPRYLDSRGLTALWREALLARAVLRGRTRGYRHHPQLRRFQARPNSIALINTYLFHIYAEAQRRGFSFDRTKLGSPRARMRLPETAGQLDYEWRHLRAKLRRRNPALARTLQLVQRPEPHPLFRLVSGGVRAWEAGAA